MSRTPALAAAFKGRWRIVEMDMIGDDDRDLGGPAHIIFAAANGEMAFGALNGAPQRRRFSLRRRTPPSSAAAC